jgi:DNA-binding transcriptional MerR regulator
MKNMIDKKYSLDELCTLTDTSKRTIRFYMGQGLVDRGEGQKKGSFYLEKHLLQLLEIKKWQKAGLSLERIKEIIRDENTDELIPPIKIQQAGTVEVWSHLLISDGISLQIEPHRSGLTPEQIRRLSKQIITAYEQLKIENIVKKLGNNNEI